MPKIVTIAGCPSPTSSATAVLNYVQKALTQANVSTENIAIRHLPSDDLLLGHAFSPAIRQSNLLLDQADAIVVATSICKGSYSGGLKAFFDLLPTDTLQHKLVLPIAIGVTAADFLAVDHALRSVFQALGGSRVLEGIYLLERQVQLYDRRIHLEATAQQRLQSGIHYLTQEARQRPTVTFFNPVLFSRSALAAS